MRLLCRVVWISVLATTLGAGCKKDGAKASAGPPALGSALVQGEVHDLRLTRDGNNALYLAEAKKPRLDGIPKQMMQGELQAAPLTGGKVRRLAQGVVNVPGGYTLSPDSRWVLALEGFNPVASSGTLKVADLQDPSAEPVTVASDVTYMMTSPDSKTLLFVTGGVMKLGPLPSGPFRDVSGEVQDATFSRDSSRLAFKRKLSAAGGLFVVPTQGGAEPQKLGEQVGDYEFSPDGKRIAFTRRSETVPSTYDLYLAEAPKWDARLLAAGSSGFEFSEDGKYLARIEGQRPDMLGNLIVGPADGTKGRKVGEKVQEFSFSPDSGAIASLELYDAPSRSGVMSVAMLPDGESKRVGYRVPNYTWAPDGKSIAFLARFLKPIYSVDLMYYRLGDEAAVKIQPGVFGYGFSPEGDEMFFRSGCIREGRACDLYSLDLKSKDAQAQKLVEGVFSFKHAPEGDRLLVTYARTDSDLYDIAVFDPTNKTHKTVDRRARVPAHFADKEGKAIVYLVGERGRGGVYAATNIQ